MAGDDLRGATALVTGASSGIGAEIARELARRGVGRILAVARRRDRLGALAAELGGVLEPRPADLADPAGLDRLVAGLPAIDVLVNDAGYGWGAPVARQGSDPARALGMIDLNCRALTALTLAVLPGMIERGRGWVLQVGSIAAFVPAPTMAIYGATKAYVHAFTEALRVETRGTGVRVHLLAPGPVATEFFEVAHPGARRPPEAAFLPADRVAREAVDALLADRPRHVPGLPVRLAAGLGALLPMPLYRPLARVALAARSLPFPGRSR